MGIPRHIVYCPVKSDFELFTLMHMAIPTLDLHQSDIESRHERFFARLILIINIRVLFSNIGREI